MVANRPWHGAPTPAGTRVNPAERLRGFPKSPHGSNRAPDQAPPRVTPIRLRMHPSDREESPPPVLIPARKPARARTGSRLPRRLRFVLDAMLGACLMMAVHLFVVQVSIVKGKSMEPCLHDGDRLVVDRFAYNLGDVQRGDVVVLRYPLDPDLDFVKRIVGLPGDRIEMHGGTLFVNGAQSDSYGCIHDHQELPPLVVPKEHYFVLGDNRPISCDSRDFGLVAQSLLKGRVRARFWPFANATFF